MTTQVPLLRNEPKATDLLLDVGAGGAQQPVNLGRQVAAHLGRAHAGQRAQSQGLDILAAVGQVAGGHGTGETQSQRGGGGGTGCGERRWELMPCAGGAQNRLGMLY